MLNYVESPIIYTKYILLLNMVYIKQKIFRYYLVENIV